MCRLFLAPVAGELHYGTCRQHYQVQNPLLLSGWWTDCSRIKITRDTWWSRQGEVEMSLAACVCVRQSTSTKSKRERGSVGERFHLSFPSAPVYQWHTHNLSVSFTHTHTRARFPKHKHINNCCGDQGHILSSVLIFHTWTWLITQVKTWHMCQVIVYASWEITEETTWRAAV